MDTSVFMLSGVYADCHLSWVSNNSPLGCVCRYAECFYAECRYAECRYAECHYAECCYAEFCNAEWHYAECRVAVVLTILKTI